MTDLLRPRDVARGRNGGHVRRMDDCFYKAKQDMHTTLHFTIQAIMRLQSVRW